MKIGTLTFEDGCWVADVLPHVAIRMKRVFPKAKQTAGTKIKVAATIENARDLDWFIERYDVEIAPSDRSRLAAAADKFREQESVLDELLRGVREPRVFEMAIEPRSYQVQAAQLALSMGGLLIADDLGLGKEQPVDAGVLTPAGWSTMGDLQVGSLVIGSDGNPVEVTGVYPQGVKPSFRVTMCDGACVEAGDEHLWTVEYWKGGRTRHRITVTTEQIRTGATVVTSWPNGTTGRCNLGKTKLYAPMLTGPVVYEPVDLPLPPYLIGQLLANGSLAHSSVTIATAVHDWPEVMARIEADGVSIGATQQFGGGVRAGITGIMPTLRDLGMMGCDSYEKRIPEAYLKAAPSDRVALLHGLMDGDGSCSATRNRVTYHSVNRALAGDVQRLVQELGGIASIRSYDRAREGKPVEYQVRVRLPESIPPFSVSRKASRYAPTLRVNPTRRIVSVEYVRDVESVCIRVAAQDRLYVTENAILTHNTCSAICVLTEPMARPALVVCPAHLPPQWQREIKRFVPGLTTHILKTGTPYDIRVGAGSKKRKQMSLSEDYEPVLPDVIITSYAKLAGWASHLAPFIRSVIYDEAHEFRVGNSLKCDAGYVVSENCIYRLGLTATPIWNNGVEIYHVINQLRPGALGTLEEFTREWCSQGGVVTDPAALGTYLRTSGLMLRRRRKDVGRELPPVQVQVIDCPSDKEAFAESAGAAAELARIILSQETTFHERGAAALELDWRVRQATGLAKARQVAAMVRMLVETGEKVVLFGWHRAVYDVWMAALADLKPVLYTGSETAKQKDAARDAFVNGDSRVLIMSNRSGSGLDGLQAVCRTVVIGELDWSPGVHEQCLSEDTEVLTRDGFRGVDQVHAGDVVAGFDMHTSAIRWVTTSRKTDRLLARGESVFGTNTEKINLRVTADHRMIVRRKTRTAAGVGRSAWEIEAAQDLASRSRRFVPVSGFEDTPGVPLTPHELRFLGWFVTDGNLNRRTRSLTIFQAAHQPWNADIVETLNGCGFRWSLHTRPTPRGGTMNLYIVPRGNLHRWTSQEHQTLGRMVAEGFDYPSIAAALHRSVTAVRKRARKLRRGVISASSDNETRRGWKDLDIYIDKDLSPRLDAMTREQLQDFLHGVRMGDGAKSERLKNVMRITSTNRTFADRLQSLCVRRGMSARISTRGAATKANRPIFDVWIEDVREAAVPRGDKANAFAVRSSRPAERVWCLTNELGTLVVRRHGKVAVVGNCIGRIERDGQEYVVTVYYVVTDDGSDPVISDVLGLKREQARGLNDPDAPLIEVQSEGGHAKRLAEAYIAKIESERECPRLRPPPPSPS